MSQQLFFNVLTFDFPAQELTFYFSDVDTGKCKKIHQSQFPANIKSIYPNAGSKEGEVFLFTTFTHPAEGFIPLTINLKTENPHLIKRYLNNKIRHYFSYILGLPLKINFVKDNQIWILNQKCSNDQWNVYDKFTLKLQFANVSSHPEIVLSYDGTSKVLKQSVVELLQMVSPTCFKWVKRDNHLLRWEDISRQEGLDYDTLYPVINSQLQAALSIPTEVPSRANRYTTYLYKLKSFIKSYLDTPEFKQLIPLHSPNFIGVEPSLVGSISEGSNLLSFNTDTCIVPHEGLKNFKPYKSSPHTNIHLFFIFHKDDYLHSVKIFNALTKGFGWFKGVYSYLSLLFHVEQNFSIQFTNRDNPLPEIEAELQNRSLNQNVKYIAIYITPFSKFVQDGVKKRVYNKLKESLLKRNIESQVIDPEKMEAQGSNWVYSLPNIAVAMLAKLGGIPWRLNTILKDELVIGVGAFKNVENGIQYIGSAFCFSNNGLFNSFELFMKHELDILAGKIAHAVRNFATVVHQPSRLIIHFYKDMSEKELQHIERALSNLGLSIPVFIITINKTDSKDIFAFDSSYPSLMPLSGTFVNISNNKYLLFNNTRYSNATVSPTDGFPFPIKLNFDCSHPELLNDAKTIQELIDQVYQFSRMYWKSIRQQNLPVTIKYPELVAQIASHFDGDDIPHYGKNTLWFL